MKTPANRPEANECLSRLRKLHALVIEAVAHEKNGQVPYDYVSRVSRELVRQIRLLEEQAESREASSDAA